MSCDRLRISGRRAAVLDELEGAEREAELGHLRTCADCRSAALAADPSLIFDLGRIETVLDEDEAERMLASVEVLRRAERFRRRPGGALRSLRVAASVLVPVLVAAALFVTNGSGGLPTPAGEPPATDRAPVEPRRESPFADAVALSSGAESPVIEDLDRPEARIYQLTEEDLSLVMIVDASLEL